MSNPSAAFINRDPSLGAGYSITLPAYDGPLDLLLRLIERNEMDISEVSICAATNQYLAMLETLTDIEPIALADFLTVASRLLYIKSNRILPRPEAEQEEEEDAGDALVRQLIEYRQFRQAADSLRARTDSGLRVHVRPVVKAVRDNKNDALPDLSEVDIEDLQSMLSSVLQRMPVEPPAPRVIMHRYTVSDQIDRVRDFVQSARSSHQRGPRNSVLFSSVLSSAYTRIEVIVTFLAILELIKQQELTVEQDATFGEIYLIPMDVQDEERAVNAS